MPESKSVGGRYYYILNLLYHCAMVPNPNPNPNPNRKEGYNNIYLLHKVFLQHQAWVRILMTAASRVDSAQ
jgi:hypothetical protein